MIFAHGDGLDAAALSWWPSLRAFAGGYRVVAPDLPGYGLSDTPAGTYTTEDYARFLGRFMDMLGIERAALVGLSLGGAVVLRFALDVPARVERLILVGSYGLQERAPGGALCICSCMRHRSTRWSGGACARAVACCAGRCGASWRTPRRSRRHCLDEVRASARRRDAGRAWRAYQRHEAGWHGLRTNLSGELHRLTAPVLILHGERDSAVPVARRPWARRNCSPTRD